MPQLLRTVRSVSYPQSASATPQAIKALWPYPALHPRLALLLSNRAAAQLSLGKPYQALKDCQMGLKVRWGLVQDPLFVRGSRFGAQGGVRARSGLVV